MIKFESQYEKHAVKVTIELHSDSTLSEVLTAFEGFLISTGYSLGGHLVLDEESEDRIKQMTTNKEI